MYRFGTELFFTHHNALTLFENFYISAFDTQDDRLQSDLSLISYQAQIENPVSFGSQAKPSFNTNDDYAGDASTTGFLHSESTQQFHLHDGDDEDWFRFELLSGQIFSAKVEGVSEFKAPLIDIVDENGVVQSGLVYVYLPESGATYIRWDNAVEGTYYTRLSHPDSGSLHAQITAYMTEDDYGNDFASAHALADNVYLSGTLNGVMDTDVFSLTLDAGESFSLYSGFQRGRFNFVLKDDLGNIVAEGNSRLATDIFYTSQTGGDYYLEYSGGANGVHGANYNYEFDATLGFDVSDNMGSAELLILSDGKFGPRHFDIFETQNDVDWYRIDLTAGHRYQIILALTQRLESNGNLDAQIVDGGGNLLFSLSNGRFEFTSTQTQTAFLQTTQTGTFSSAYNYDIRWNEFSTDVGDTVDTAGVITADETIQSYYDEVGDVDWYAFTVSEPGSFRFILQDAGSLETIIIRDGQGNIVNTENTFLIREYGDPEVFDRIVNFETSTAGTYYVELGPARFENRQYTLISESLTDDNSSNSGTNSSLIEGETVTGQIDFQNDRDWHRFSVEQGDIVILKFTHDLTSSSPLIGFLNAETLDGQGTSQRLSYSQDGFSIRQFTATEAADFFASMSAQGLIGYTVSYHIAQDDHGNNFESASEISLDSQIEASFDYAGDQDVFSINLTEGDIVEFSKSFILNPTIDDGISIFDSSGNLLDFTKYVNNDGESATFIAQSTGTYYITVAGSFRSFDNIYNFQTRLISDDAVSIEDTDLSVNVGETLSVSYDYGGDVDYVRFDAVAGQTIFALLTSEATIYSHLLIVDDQGNFVAGPTQSDHMSFPRRDDLYNGQISHTFDASGTYYFVVEASYRNDLIHDSGINSQLQIFSGDALRASSRYQNINGTDSNDIIVADLYSYNHWGYDGDDLFVGTRFDESFIPGLGADTIYGIGGYDWVYYFDSLEAVTVNLLTGLGVGGTAEGDIYHSLYGISASPYDDILIGDNSDNAFSGRAGADLITGNGGRDLYFYGAEGDLNGDVITDFTDQNIFEYLDLTSFAANEAVTVQWIGQSQFSGTAGELRYELVGNNTLIFYDRDGDGNSDEALTLLNFSSDLQITPTFEIYGENRFLGSDQVDEVIGTEVNDIFYGGGGRDTFVGNGGNDYVYVSAGGDVIDVERDGVHTLDFSYAVQGIEIIRSFYTSMSIFASNDGFDALPTGQFRTYQFFTKIIGSDHYDFIDLDGQDSIVTFIDGGLGRDRIHGGSNGEILHGGEGHDVILGIGGDDYISGDAGNDILFGGIGADIFAFGLNDGADRIRDFSLSEDIIQISLSPYVTMAHLSDMMSQHDGYVLIDLGGGNSIRIDGVNIDDLEAGHFRFSGIAEDGVGPFRDPGRSYADIKQEEWDESTSAQPEKEEAPLVSETLDEDFEMAPADTVLATISAAGWSRADLLAYFDDFLHEPIEDLPEFAFPF